MSQRASKDKKTTHKSRQCACFTSCFLPLLLLLLLLPSRYPLRAHSIRTSFSKGDYSTARLTALAAAVSRKPRRLLLVSGALPAAAATADSPAKESRRCVCMYVCALVHCAALLFDIPRIRYYRITSNESSSTPPTE